MNNIFNGSLYLEQYLEQKIDQFRINLKNKQIMNNQLSILKLDYENEVVNYVKNMLLEVNFSSFKLEYLDLNSEIQADMRYYSFELKGDLNLFFCILEEPPSPIFELCQINTNNQKLYIAIATNNDDNKDKIAHETVLKINQLRSEMNKRVKLINEKTQKAINIIKSLHEETNNELIFESRLVLTIKKQLNL